ncbi:MAG: methionine adenosyltransferase [Candidatus Eisenbacteria bacterium]|nr:methionine adenosyltransferase [Candidatus Eisenbacteria bacterium]
MEKHLFTSESVTGGHPDKVADQISDAILDGILEQDPAGRVACETMVTTGLAFISGEITTQDAYVDIPTVVREMIRQIGYTDATYGFDWLTCAVVTAIGEQSADIWLGDSSGHAVHEGGAGDQGMMFGYATEETPELMPMPISLAHRLARRLSDVRVSGVIDFLRPDGKTQVTIEYDNGVPARVDTVVVSAQHQPDVTIKELREAIRTHVVEPTLPAELVTGDDYTLYINPTGRFVKGGPHADCGLTGRKIIVDTYGGLGSHGGGCFSGKDPTKVDRSGSYAARHVAKNIVGAGLAKKCEIEIAYAIGVAEPISIMVDSLGTGTVPDEELVALVRKNFDLRPGAIIDRLNLRRPIYRQTAAYGHFGREEPDFTWELLDMVDDLRKG